MRRIAQVASSSWCIASQPPHCSSWGHVQFARQSTVNVAFPKMELSKAIIQSSPISQNMPWPQERCTPVILRIQIQRYGLQEHACMCIPMGKKGHVVGRPENGTHRSWHAWTVPPETDGTIHTCEAVIRSTCMLVRPCKPSMRTGPDLSHHEEQQVCILSRY